MYADFLALLWPTHSASTQSVYIQSQNTQKSESVDP